MQTFQLLLTLILSLVGRPVTISPEAGVELDAVCSQAPTERLCGIAHDIDEVTIAAERLPFEGPAAREASAVALLAVAHHESGLRENVQDCSLCEEGSQWCDAGRSISMFQLMTGFAWAGHSRDQICSSNKLASRLALRLLTRWSKGTSLQMFSTYAGCRGRECSAAAGTEATFQTLLNKAGIRRNARFGPRYYELR